MTKTLRSLCAAALIALAGLPASAQQLSDAEREAKMQALLAQAEPGPPATACRHGLFTEKTGKRADGTGRKQRRS